MAFPDLEMGEIHGLQFDETSFQSDYRYFSQVSNYIFYLILEQEKVLVDELFKIASRETMFVQST